MSSLPSVRFLDRASPPHIATLVLIAGVATLPMNMFLPSLPTMAAHFGTPYAVLQLSVAIYLGASAIMQLIVGPLSDRYGRRPVILAGMGIFVLASVASVLAPTAEVFLATRILQASVVVGMSLGRAAIRDMVPQDQAASMIGYVTMGMAVLPMIGPAVGGALDEAFGWQSVFWFQALVGVAVMGLVWSDMGETATQRSASFSDQFRDYPELLTSPRFWGYSAAAAFGSGGFFAYLGGGPFVGSEIYGLSPFWLGIYFGAPALGYAVGNYISGRYTQAYGIDAMILTGAIIVASFFVAALATFYAGFGSAEVFFGFMTFLGLGNGLVMPNANAGLLSVRPQLAGTASGLGGAIMIGGGAALSALAGTLLTVEAGPFPILWMILVTSCLSLVSILIVIQRKRQLGLQSRPE